MMVMHRAVIALSVAIASSVALRSDARQQPEASANTAVLWRDPGAIGEKDLKWGIGSADRQPAPPFTFVKEDLSGSKPKVRVIDQNGVTWNIKFAGNDPSKNEVQAEVAANRVLAALGYLAEEDYFLAAGTIEKVTQLERARSSVDPNGRFRMARFERRSADRVRTDKTWTFEANPFVDSKELSGLKLAMALVNNWDNKYQNTSVDLVTLPDGRVEEHYLFSDWGAAFGRMSGPPSWDPAPTRWNVKHYQEQPFVREAKDGAILIHFKGQVPIESVPLEHAGWFADLAGQLRVEQLRAAFAAAGASSGDAEAFATRMLEKIAELKAAMK